ncbi:hypothetical protein PACTADRAFT_2276 [Pachysolen tannophilus NRRL Y-2460]|uniref:NADH dehydrogenase [ubiquinone] 1 beta subcomplex subunit 3 n=1 Tax=Pachysolen tannophilus NRRL Y-2460 TaxID=669874 RepID=A0A1E4TW64_PACTA|nr:hypothetical protein PACTADRAFT_2276 [Pachysolen tannophilus NRRL Y-2460]
MAGVRSEHPWKKRDAWRLKGLFPGFGWGLGAFILYCGYEKLFLENKTSEHH